MIKHYLGSWDRLVVGFLILGAARCLLIRRKPTGRGIVLRSKYLVYAGAVDNCS